MYKRIETNSWDFRNADTKEYSHCYHSYPAMMIPQIARKLIKTYAPKSTKLIFDPYMGSGTTLVEASIAGIDSIGTDINPLARFMAKVKTTEFELTQIEKNFEFIKSKINNYKQEYHKYSYDDFKHITNPSFWYSIENINKLQYLTEVIKSISTENRSFFQLILSESVREASYTRNGEFKRYRMPKNKIDTFAVDPFKLFIEKYKRNRKGLLEYNSVKNKGKVDIANFNTVNELNSALLEKESVDMVVTSPPYGDSKTTVAYGQFSRWANEWFSFENAKKLDTLLMGGKVLNVNIDELKTNSIKQELLAIKKLDENRYKDVESFLIDYQNSIKNVAKLVRKGGVVCYVVGNRTVKGIQIPLDYFTAEMFETNGFTHHTTIVRSIPNKRMPSKTSPTNKKGQNVGTMTSEYIVILSKK